MDYDIEWNDNILYIDGQNFGEIYQDGDGYWRFSSTNFNFNDIKEDTEDTRFFTDEQQSREKIVSLAHDYLENGQFEENEEF